MRDQSGQDQTEEAPPERLREGGREEDLLGEEKDEEEAQNDRRWLKQEATATKARWERKEEDPVTSRNRSTSAGSKKATAKTGGDDNIEDCKWPKNKQEDGRENPHGQWHKKAVVKRTWKRES